MKWKWDVRPPEFIALSPADRRRVWKRCYWQVLRRPRVFAVLLVFAPVGALTAGLVNGLLHRSSSWAALGLRFAASTIIIGLVTLAFARYVAHVLREELRACATRDCLNCWYDLTGNTSGVCPECGTPRSAAS